MDEKLATFKIDREKWGAFISKAKINGTSASALLKDFIDQYLGANEATLEARVRELERRLGELNAA